MTALDVCMYLGSAFVSGYCVGFGVYSWRRFFEII